MYTHISLIYIFFTTVKSMITQENKLLSYTNLQQITHTYYYLNIQISFKNVTVYVALMSTNPREATRPAIPWRNRSPCHPQQWMLGNPPPHTAIWPPCLHTSTVFISYYSEFSIQQHHWFPPKLWLHWICQYTEFHRDKDRIHLYVLTSSSIELYIILCLK